MYSGCTFLPVDPRHYAARLSDPVYPIPSRTSHLVPSAGIKARRLTRSGSRYGISHRRCIVVNSRGDEDAARRRGEGKGRASSIRAKLCYSFKFALSDRRHGSATSLFSLPLPLSLLAEGSMRVIKIKVLASPRECEAPADNQVAGGGGAAASRSATEFGASIIIFRSERVLNLLSQDFPYGYA